ncbi:MAG: hypothetical protein KBD00_06045 [Candidatus Peribacteraceae bacterium]|nr:hypothetical protein [Candidatus Peribacteraceae bacterium]
MKKKLFLAGLLAAIPLPAAAISIREYWACNPEIFYCNSGNIPAIIVSNIVIFVSNTIVAVGTLAFVYGGVRMLVSQGGEGKEAGKKSMQFAVMGIIFAFLAQRIVQFVLDIITSIA